MIMKSDPHNFALVQAKSIGPQIYNILRAQIIRGELTPGTRISEAEVSKVMAVSRQPVREAFIKLRNDELVEVRPQRGTFITKISINAVSNARFIREAVEADIVKLLVENCSTKLVAELRALVRQQQNVDHGDLDSFMELDEKFHRTMAELADKKFAWKVIASMKAHFDRVRYLSSTQKPLSRLINQHEAVVNAIEKKDAVKAEAAIRYHLQEVLRDLPVMVSQRPDIFERQDSV